MSNWARQMTDDELSGTPVKAEVKVDAKVGERGTEKIIDAAADTFSLSTEVLGLLGDAVRWARIEVAARITRRAKIIADENGLKLVAPPLKFLVPFYERASTEDESDETLMEMWARLLVSAGSEYQDKSIRYSSILSELTSKQAMVLNQLVRNNSESGGLGGWSYRLLETAFYFIVDRSIDQIRGESDPKKIEEHLRVMLSVRSTCIAQIFINVKYESLGKSFISEESDVYSEENSADFDSIRSLGLIEVFKMERDINGIMGAHVLLYYVTELGFDFWLACNALSLSSSKGR